MKFLSLLFLSALIYFGAAVFSDDGTCVGNTESFAVAAGFNRDDIACAAGTWTLTGNLNAQINSEWEIFTDRVVVTGSYFSSNAVSYKYHMDVDTPSNSGKLTIQAPNPRFRGTFHFDLVTHDRVGQLIRLRFAEFPAIDENDHGFGSGQNSNPTMTDSTLPYLVQFCRDKTDTTFSWNTTYAEMSFVLTDNGNDCTTGRGDRTWVIAILVLLAVVAAGFLIFAWLTCKFSEEWREDIWDVE